MRHHPTISFDPVSGLGEAGKVLQNVSSVISILTANPVCKNLQPA
jgi:hypothetical protein